MPITITAPLAHMTLTLSAHSADELAQAIGLTLGRASAPVRGVRVAAETMGDLWDAIEGIAAQMDDPDRITAVRLDEIACRAELDVDARPVDPRRLH